MTSFCVIGIGGASGTGKTTLIEKAIPVFRRQGLSVGVIKHAHHRLTFDRRDKDTDRFYHAGADYVFAHDGELGFARFPHAGGLSGALGKAPSGLDLVLVEGHKGEEIPRVRLEKGRGKGRGAGAEGAAHTLYRGDPDCVGSFVSIINNHLAEYQRRRTIRAGLLVGGGSRRMGRPKGLMKAGGITLMERAFGTLSAVSSETVLLGRGDTPSDLGGATRLPDVPEVHGPLAGLLSAFRWAPDSAWVISAVDMPFMTTEAWRWLLGCRRPGAWAVMPVVGRGRAVEATAAVYEPQIFPYAEAIAGRGITSLQAIADHPKVIRPAVPPSLAPAWRNVNTMEQWRKALQELNSRR